MVRASLPPPHKHNMRQLGALEPRLHEVIYGQDDAIEAITSAITLSRAGLRAENSSGADNDSR